jgi:hypothetical protein
MKLAPANLSIARWHVSPETGRIECRWALKKPPIDDYLCAVRGRAKRRLGLSPRWSPLRRRQAISVVTNLSTIP